MKNARPIVLSIAGFDPSGGAGVLADVKTFEANKVYGMGIISANTIQNEDEFERVDWIEADTIIKQFKLLSQKKKIRYVKIGLIQSLSSLNKIICQMPTNDHQLIWDPILKASAGFEFHKKIDGSTSPSGEKLHSILKNIFLLTPNTEEAKALAGMNDAMEAAKELSKHCHVYLKGGHSEKAKGKDHLFTKEGKQFSFNPKLKNVHAKHGSGCVLSSAITANLANGHPLHRACMKGKQYTEKFLASNKTLLGYHKL